MIFNFPRQKEKNIPSYPFGYFKMDNFQLDSLSNTIIKIFKDIWKNEYSMIPSYPLFQNCETIVWIIFNSFFILFFTKIHSHAIIKRFKNIWREIRRFQVTQYLKIRLSI